VSEGSSAPRTLVLDTGVAVKFYVPEELREQALNVLAAAESGRLELVAPSTLHPEFFNALWWKHRRDELSREEVREGWEQLVADRPASLYAPEDLMPRAVEITLESGVIVYDTLFLALAEDTGTLVVTADVRLLKALKGTSYAHLAHPLSDASSLIPGTG
jgi:predicted nucleic acid-binding protein